MSEAAAGAVTANAGQANAGVSATAADQTAGQADQTNNAGSAQKTEAPKPEVYDVKINGRMVKLTKDELIQRASMSEASQQRFEEAARMRKEAEEVIGNLRDPKRVMKVLQDPKLGLTKDQIRQEFEDWYTREFIEPEQLSPEQKKLREAERRIKEFEDAEKARQEEKTRSERESQTAQVKEQVQKDIIAALESGKLPKTNFTVRRLAYWMQRNLVNGFDAPMDVVIGQVRDEMQGSFRDLVDTADVDVLISLLGDGFINKVRKWDLERLKKSRGMQTQTQTQDSYGVAPRETGERQEPIDSREVSRRIRNLQRTGRY